MSPHSPPAAIRAARPRLGARARRLLVATALYLGAVAAGLGSAWWLLKHAPWMSHSVQVGAWKTNLRAGSEDADLYTRAWVAVNAVLALGRDETMYFVATQDEQGRPLRAQCRYRIDGTAPAARWWSITAYADDMFLMDVPNKRYSLNGSTAALDAQGRFAIELGPQPPATGLYWLPTDGKPHGVVLTLRLYNPAPNLQAAPADLAPPAITALEACA
ncbi:MAG: DUF1214 domain-containing protein [Rhodoferax sp.]